MAKQITIEIEELDEKAMYLHEHLGNGTLGDVTFDAHTRIPDRSIVVEIEKKRYLVNSQAVIKAVIEAVS